MEKYNIGDNVDLVIKVNRHNVRIIGESKTGNSIKVCCNYRLNGRENWKPIYCWISKKDILKVTKIKAKKNIWDWIGR